MYLPLLRQGRAGVTSAVKHHVQKARHELTRLFQCRDTKQELSKHLKLLPDYFSFELLDQFCTSPLHEQFCENKL
jgi:hypothetical protein